MAVLVIGAHHGLGALVVAEAEGRGLSVRRFEGDVLEAGAVGAALGGVSAVVSTLGPRTGSAADLCARGTANIVVAMKAAGVPRLVAVSGALIGYPEVQLGRLYRFIESRVPRAQLADRREAERIVTASGLDWTLVRPTRLTDARPKGRWRDDPAARVGALAHIGRADAAEAVVTTLGDPGAIGRAWVLQY